ncbi:MAG: hypothetical protein IBX55_20845 [Methyloprofundus sp.]|nr:hypothetical protein [Methyloprofundus sp.]
MRDPRLFYESGRLRLQDMLKAAFLSINYGLIDNAAAILSEPDVCSYLKNNYSIDLDSELSIVSRHAARRDRRDRRNQFKSIVRDFAHLMQNLVIVK